MATLYKIHPQTPQPQKLSAVVAALHQGAVVLYPTDTVYAIGCSLEQKKAIQQVRQLKQLTNDKPLTFLCDSLSNIAAYAYVEDAAYRLIRRLIPGPYTFILPATKAVPRLVMNPKRRTVGIRVPDHPISQALIQALDMPIISTSALSVVGIQPEDTADKAELFDRLEKRVDIIIEDGEPLTYELSSIFDMTEDVPVVVRQGQGWETAAALI